MVRPPAFLITIDTEGDDLWSCPERPETRNARCLPRFQELLERYGLRPTYLTNWEMCHDPAFQELGRDVLARDAGEIGMHLHAWDTPPLVPLTDDDRLAHPFLIEYPDPARREKMVRMTEALEDTFDVPMRSHRAGRWAFDDRYATDLIELGYHVDCSVTPMMEWIDETSGDGRPVLDYRDAPHQAHWLGPADSGSAGPGRLLEVPMTITPRGRGPGVIQQMNDLGSLASLGLLNRWLARPSWLRPDGENLSEMLRILGRARLRGWRYAMFMLHSSELMPGGSPTFRTEASIEKLYEDMEILFERAAAHFVPMTLWEFYVTMAPRPLGERAMAPPRGLERG